MSPEDWVLSGEVKGIFSHAPVGWGGGGVSPKNADPTHYSSPFVDGSRAPSRTGVDVPMYRYFRHSRCFRLYIVEVLSGTGKQVTTLDPKSNLKLK